MRQKVNGKLFAFTTIPRRFWHSSYMQQKKSSPIYTRAPSRQLLVGYVACVRDVQIARQRIRAGSVRLEFSSRVKTFRATRLGSARLDSKKARLVPVVTYDLHKRKQEMYSCVATNCAGDELCATNCPRILEKGSNIKHKNLSYLPNAYKYGTIYGSPMHEQNWFQAPNLAQ